jgi:hypothetical protein
MISKWIPMKLMDHGIGSISDIMEKNKKYLLYSKEENQIPDIS